MTMMVVVVVVVVVMVVVVETGRHLCRRFEYCCDFDDDSMLRC